MPTKDTSLNKSIRTKSGKYRPGSERDDKRDTKSIQGWVVLGYTNPELSSETTAGITKAVFLASDWVDPTKPKGGGKKRRRTRRIKRKLSKKRRRRTKRKTRRRRNH